MPDNLYASPYVRPRLQRGVDPQQMNWLWGLICELAQIEPARVVRALHAQEIAVDSRRVQRWLVQPQDGEYFPMSIAELERNVRALLALRQQENQAAEGSATGADSADMLAAPGAGKIADGTAAVDDPLLPGEAALRELA